VPGTQSGAIYLMDGDVITEVRGNNVFQNTGYQFYYDNIEGNYHDIDATYNYFGTNNDAEIQNGIYDDFDDPLLGVINYSPFRTEPAGFPGGEKPFIIGKIGRPWAIVTSSGKNETWELGSFGFDAKDSQENLMWSVTGADASKFNVYIDDVILILRKAIGLDD